MTVPADQVEQFARLFAGRTDAVGTDQGGMLPATPESWEGLWELHLNGNSPIGTYPLLDDNTVTWGCIDFDEGEDASWAHAVNVTTVLSTFDVKGWIERSRSKGYHVWVFPEYPNAAEVMREALLAACQLVDAPTTEINPKQVDVTKLGKGKGNYLRLPYAHARASGRQEMVDPIGPASSTLTLSWFLERALSELTPWHNLYRLSELYSPPVIARPQVEPSKLDGDPVKRMGGLAYTIWKDGPLPDRTTGHMDRSGGLFKLAVELRKDGQHTYGEALQLVSDADYRWGKYMDRDGHDGQIVQLLGKIWG